MLQNGRILNRNETSTLKELGVKAMDQFTVTDYANRHHSAYELFVKTWSLQTVVISDLEPSSTISQLKDEIQRIAGIPRAHQWLLWDRGRLHNDEVTLSSCNIQNASTISTSRR